MGRFVQITVDRALRQTEWEVAEARGGWRKRSSFLARQVRVALRALQSAARCWKPPHLRSASLHARKKTADFAARAWIPRQWFPRCAGILLLSSAAILRLARRLR